MFSLVTFLMAPAFAAAPPACKDGAVIDLNVNPVVSVDAASEGAFVTVEGGKAASPDHVDLMSSGFTASAWVFSGAAYLEGKGLTRAALERGGYLRLQHGVFLESEGEISTECLLTYDVAPLEVRLAEEKLAAAKKRQAMETLLVCDPEGTLQHAIKAPQPTGAIKVPPGQAAQGDAVLTLTVATSGEFKIIGEQTVKIAGGKFVSATSSAPAVFCEAHSFGDLCVNTEAVFALTKDAAFSVSTGVDWDEQTLSECAVSR